MAVPTLATTLSIAFLTAVSAAEMETITVPPLRSVGFIFNLGVGDTVRGSISVSGGSGNDVDFWVTDPGGSHILNFGRVSRGTDFSFRADRSGAYTLHFDNSFSLISSKMVIITFDVERPIIPGVGAGPLDWSSIVLVAIVLAIIVIVVVAAVIMLRRRPPAAPAKRPFAVPETGFMYCEYCGAKNLANYVFCSKCGKGRRKGSPI